MNNENSRSAGLRRSAIAERIRLREEWSALKGTAEAPVVSAKALTKRMQNRNLVMTKPKMPSKQAKLTQVTSDVLRGVVALVEVGAEPRALPLRAALAALGATVVPSWSPLVTHIVWTQGGCRATRAKGRALACRLVSPLWVEACAAAARRLPSQMFPAAARASDLPSPNTLTRLLKQAEKDNIPLANLLSDSSEEKEGETNRLRLSTDTSNDTSHDKSADTSHDNTVDESRVNTAPRRLLPATTAPTPQKKSRRKLFTQKGAEEQHTDYSEEETEVVPKPCKKLTQRDVRNLMRAERMAKRILAARSPATTKPSTAAQDTPKIVITGMSRPERRVVCEAVRSLGGRIQTQVNRKTTHVLLGSCRENPDEHSANAVVIPRCDNKNARTLSSLAGAARGCRVLQGQWALDCAAAKRWLHHHGYEVPHLKKIQQKAFVERKALGLLRSEYAYDVFSGMRVRLAADVDKRDAALHLLTLCGARVLRPEGEVVPSGGSTQQAGDFDITLGTGDGEISSKWVFDSVAAARMRTTRRYVT